MISDTLSDAEAQLAIYLTRYPEVYRGFEQEITRLMNSMRELRFELDSLPEEKDQ